MEGILFIVYYSKHLPFLRSTTFACSLWNPHSLAQNPAPSTGLRSSAEGTNECNVNSQQKTKFLVKFSSEYNCTFNDGKKLPAVLGPEGVISQTSEENLHSSSLEISFSQARKVLIYHN